MRSKKLENVFKQKGSQYRNKEDKKKMTFSIFVI